MLPIPNPLHPAIVHFPIALAVLLPALAFAALVAIRAGWVPARTWVAVVVLQFALVGFAWFAMETGEDQEEKVEKVVAERHIEEHEEAAERLFYIAIAAALVSAAGLLQGSRGQAARAATLVAGLAVLAASVAVGHSGGELVYKHGAASAYTEPATISPSE
jgi:uncharacterized membrane protein